NRRYYAGGAQSIRGWSSRSLAAGGGYGGFGGNALIEMNAEIRWQPFPGKKGKSPSMLENIWLVLFGDAGNLWDEPYAVRLRECAIAGGMGLRYNLFFGPLRIDYGMRMYEPTAVEHPWFFQRNFWKDVFKRGQIHLGIGHAF
ncbi:MAG: BamA/TamA family outer membrane protein, partial [Bacteroidota bacterium]|nr:BamA/TamA family outer membrane protein [Bacteroidota bacterium]